MRPPLAALAAGQGGVVTRAQLRACGYGDAAVRALLRSGRWTALRRGVYAQTARLECSPEHPRLIAAWLALDGRAVLSHRSAAALHGLALLGPPGPPQLTAAPGVLRPRRTADLRIATATLPRHHLADVDGVPATSPARTVVDLARSLPFPAAAVVAESALRAARTDRAELDRVLRDCWTWPGVRRAARVVDFAGDGSDSPLETLCRLRFARHGLPPPEQQALIVDPGDGWFARVDFLWPSHRTVVEADGRTKYAEPADLWREKLRQERIEELGYAVVRVTWTQVTRRPAETVARVLRAFARAATRSRSPLPTARPA